MQTYFISRMLLGVLLILMQLWSLASEDKSLLNDIDKISRKFPDFLDPKKAMVLSMDELEKVSEKKLHGTKIDGILNKPLGNVERPIL